MGNIVIMADSTTDLGKDLAERFDVKILPLHVAFANDSTDYLDGVTLTSEAVYQKVDACGQTPKTGAINVNEFIGYFKPEIEKGNDILFTGIGSGLSSTYANAVLASKEFPAGRIQIVDSQNLSTGTGLLVLHMARLRDQGLKATEIADAVRQLVPHVSAKFCIDRLDYLFKGGRCSGFTKTLAHMLHIHPILKMVDNKLVIEKKIRGRYQKAVDAQYEEFLSDLPHIDPFAVFVTDSGHMDGEDVDLIEKVKKAMPAATVYHTRAGCVVSSHCGPKTIGLLYVLKAD